MELFLSHQHKLFSVLGRWAWVFVLLVLIVAVVLIINRKVIWEIFSSQNPRFYINERRTFEKTFSKNREVSRMIENGEENLICCSHCKHLESCSKCSKSDYDLGQTVCGDFEL